MFESDTRAGRAFDLGLLVSILASILVVMLDGVREVSERHARLFYGAEWAFTALFTVEYLIRLWIVRRPFAYARS